MARKKKPTDVPQHPRRPDQVFSEQCPLCPRVLYGSTDRGLRGGKSLHMIKAHGEKPLNYKGPMLIGRKGTLLYHLQTSKNTDMGGAAALFSEQIRKERWRETG